MKEQQTVFEFNGIAFDRFKFLRSNKYSEEFFEKLIKNGTGYSKMKYVDAVNDEFNEEIQIKVSFSLTMKVLALVIILLMIWSAANVFLIQAFIFFSISLVLWIVSDNLINRAHELFSGKTISRELVNTLFDK